MADGDGVDAPARETEGRWLCCCLLVNVVEGTKHPCNDETTGPDDPFCRACTPRHAGDPHVTAGAVRVEAWVRPRPPVRGCGSGDGRRADDE